MKNNQYYPLFDYLRLFLAGVVMIHHSGIIFWMPAGKLAVDIFFALSGWLIGNILLNTENSQLRKFFFNRAVRIWIPYYIALILILIPSIATDPIDLKWIEFIVYKVTQTYNIFGTPQIESCRECMPLNGIANHFWSVNAEEQFYLLAPILLVVFPFFGRSIYTWLGISIVLWVMAIYPAISFGVLAAIFNKKHPQFYEKKSVKAGLFIVLVISIIGISPADSFRHFNYQVFAPFLSISVVLLLAYNGTATKLGTFVGGISYPLYLNHWIGIVFANKVMAFTSFDNEFIRITIFTSLNILVAGLLYLYVERKALNARNTLFTEGRGLTAMMLAYGSMLAGILFGTFILIA